MRNKNWADLNLLGLPGFGKHQGVWLKRCVNQAGSYLAQRISIYLLENQHLN